MINKKDLIGKYITYIDKNCSYRTHKVIKIVGNVLTVQDTLKSRYRIKHEGNVKYHGVPTKQKIVILGVYNRRTKELEEIKW